jgi:ankyrin repeat protein
MILGLLLLFQAPPDAEARREAYLDAVRKGDVAAVKTVLDQGVEVDARFRYDRTALSFAADRGHLEIVRISTRKLAWCAPPNWALTSAT